MGDIDGDADPEGHYVVPQDYSVVELLLPDLMLQTGETYEVPVAIKPTWTSRGIQFALRLDTAFLSLDDLIDGQIELQNTGGNPNFRFAPDGTLRILQLFDPTEVLQQGYPLFTCQITALQSGALKDKMQLLTDTLPGILVDFEGKKHPMKPHYYVVSSATLPAAAAQDARIFPNPFSDHTTLSFHLSRPSHVYLDIYTMTGAWVYSSRQVLPAGPQVMEIPGLSLPDNSLLVYHLQINGTSQRGTLCHLNRP